MLSKHLNPLADCNIKMQGERGFEGYASVFGSVDSYGDTVAKGAFTDTIREAKERGQFPLMLFGHSPGRPLGKWTEMLEDDKGLFVRGEFTPGNRDAEDIYASVKHGAITGLSIGFMDRDSDQLETGGRLLKNIDLREVSIVTFPAEQAAQITSVKSRLESLESLKDCETFLREAGLSRTEAVTFVGRLKSCWQGELVSEIEAKREAIERQERTSRLVAYLESLTTGE